MKAKVHSQHSCAILKARDQEAREKEASEKAAATPNARRHMGSLLNLAQNHTAQVTNTLCGSCSRSMKIGLLNIRTSIEDSH